MQKSSDRARRSRKKSRSIQASRQRSLKRRRTNSDDPLPQHEPQDSLHQEQERFTEGEVREEALRTVFQYREKPTDSSYFSNAVSSEMNRLQRQINNDLQQNINTLTPKSYVVCNVCGHETHIHLAVSPRAGDREIWAQMLEHKLYNMPLNLEDFTACRSCANILNASRIPSTALCKGWVF